MPDYKELYLTMMRETEKAIRTLVEAQKTCEERILQSEDGDEIDGTRLNSAKNSPQPTDCGE